MRMKSHFAVLLACIGAMTVHQGVAQDSPAETTDASPTSRDDAENLVPRIPGEVESFAPQTRDTRSPIRPGLTRGSSWDTLLGNETKRAAPVALPERTFLNRVRGEVIAGPHGTRIFVIQDPLDRDPGAMLLLPSSVLQRFDEFVFKRNSQVPALASGQVFRYDGRNYLLPSALGAAMNSPGETLSDAVVDNIESETPTEETKAGSAADPQEGPQLDAVRQGEIDSLIESLERRPVYNRQRARGGSGQPTAQTQIATEAGGSSQGGSAETGSVDAGRDGTGAAMVDGSYISARRGRMIRSIDGNWVFVSDNEAGDGLRLTLLPCRMLERLEGIAFREGDSAAVTLSGRVHKFWGDQYILPTLFERERRDGVEPLQ